MILLLAACDALAPPAPYRLAIALGGHRVAEAPLDCHDGDATLELPAGEREASELVIRTDVTFAAVELEGRTRWLEVLRDPDDAAKGSVRWEMDPQGEYRTRLDGPDDVRAFTCGFVVRGFDIDEGLPLDLGKAIDTAELETEAIAPALPGGGP